VGHVLGKGNERAGEQTRIAEKTRARLDSFLFLWSKLLPARMYPNSRERSLQSKTKRNAQNDLDSPWLEYQV
jgi:hypothetical protein